MKKFLTFAIVLLLSSVAVKSYAQPPSTSTFTVYNATNIESITFIPSGSYGQPMTVYPSQSNEIITVEDAGYTIEFKYKDYGSLENAKVRTAVTSSQGTYTQDTAVDTDTKIATVYAYFGGGFDYSFTAFMY